MENPSLVERILILRLRRFRILIRTPGVLSLEITQLHIFKRFSIYFQKNRDFSRNKTDFFYLFNKADLLSDLCYILDTIRQRRGERGCKMSKNMVLKPLKLLTGDEEGDKNTKIHAEFIFERPHM